MFFDNQFSEVVGKLPIFIVSKTITFNKKSFLILKIVSILDSISYIIPWQFNILTASVPILLHSQQLYCIYIGIAESTRHGTFHHDFRIF
jgi:hypothetical protein